MKILFDQGTPAPLRWVLKQHNVSTAHEMGWGELDNGALLTAAASEFDVLVTTDKNLRYQQKLAGRRLAVLILPTTSWPQLQAQQGQIVSAINALRSGDIVEMKSG
jgi:predicted nuclease of predicted toxin-antitoxin system